MAPEPLPGPPGIATFEMPRQPHELSTSAAINNTRPCQARWRMLRSPVTGRRLGLLLAPTALVARLTGRRLGLLVAPTALVARLTGHPLRQPALADHRRWEPVRPPARASARPVRGPPQAPAGAAVSEPAAGSGRSPARSGPRRRRSAAPAASAGPIGPARCWGRPSVRPANPASAGPK